MEEEYPVEAKYMSVLHIAQSPFGEPFFEFLKDLCFVNETTYAPSSPNDIFVAEGRRQVYLELVSALDKAYGLVGPGGVEEHVEQPESSLETQNTLGD